MYCGVKITTQAQSDVPAAILPQLWVVWGWETSLTGWPPAEPPPWSHGCLSWTMQRSGNLVAAQTACLAALSRVHLNRTQKDVAMRIHCKYIFLRYDKRTVFKECKHCILLREKQSWKMSLCSPSVFQRSPKHKRLESQLPRKSRSEKDPVSCIGGLMFELCWILICFKWSLHYQTVIKQNILWWWIFYLKSIKWKGEMKLETAGEVCFGNGQEWWKLTGIHAIIIIL